MKINFYKGKLPQNFTALGYISIIGGIVAFFNIGIIASLISLFGLTLISIRDGIVINTDELLLKEYISVLFVRFGRWRNIKNPSELQIFQSMESQTMSVLSISRQDVRETYNLFLITPEEEIALYNGEKNIAIEKGRILSNELNIDLNIDEY
jgi:hypothetical protein